MVSKRKDDKKDWDSIVFLKDQGNKLRTFNIYKKGDKYLAKGYQATMVSNGYKVDRSSKFNKIRMTSKTKKGLINKIGSKYDIKKTVKL